MKQYTNDLHDALLKKNNTVFWQCWRSKFESNVLCKLIEGSVDPDVIAGKFASCFTSIFSCNDPQKANSIEQHYDTLRANYSSLPLNENHNIDIELVSNVVCDLTHGKDVDINGLSTKHLCVILSRLFQLMLMCWYVPVGFRHSYIVPIPKSSQCSNKALTCDDFSGIAISLIISKEKSRPSSAN